ncbi:MAG: hypothetical protein DI551_04540 [Micavibrio aeruginosavorus]|uniref:Uncharacterized protein n=1 Tax=Micavibrio aeruginosavorus TaxID=349221 RepID=A0A2W5N7K4_9BACT|nr:MAG: hypothetical protein DI551_04540 [Micavibrio aeruginosavorus]
MTLAQIFYQWIDLFWVPVALLTVEKGKRLFTCGFVLSCVLLLRLQVELLQQIGMPNGFFGWLGADIFLHGVITYGAFVAFFFIFSHFSQGSDKSVHMAASITILIAAFCVSSFIMLL